MPKNAHHNLHVRACFAGGSLRARRQGLSGEDAARHEFILSLSAQADPTPRSERSSNRQKSSGNDTAVTNIIYNDVKVRLVSSLKDSIDAISRQREFPNDSNAPRDGVVDSGIIVTYGSSVFIRDSRVRCILKCSPRPRSYELGADAFREFKTPQEFANISDRGDRCYYNISDNREILKVFYGKSNIWKRSIDIFFFYNVLSDLPKLLFRTQCLGLFGNDKILFGHMYMYARINFRPLE